MIVLVLGSAVSVRADEQLPFDVRLAMGVASEGTTSAFVTEGAVMGRIPWFRRGPGSVIAMPEVGGGAFDTVASRSSYGHAGLGLGYRVGPLVLGVVPSLVAGSIEEPRFQGHATGYRVTAVAELSTLLGVQLSRQVLGAGPRARDQLIATASINLTPLLFLAYVAAHR